MPPLSLDPALFRPEAITRETADHVAYVEKALAELPSVMELGAPLTRQLRREGRGLLPFEKPDPTARWETASALDRDVPVRIFTPEGQARGVYLHIHGGGHTLGAADAQDERLSLMSDGLGIAVVSVEYRLAPEHPWPAPADDCEAAALWLIDVAGEFFGTSTLMIGGESAGAHLSTVSLLRVRDRLGHMPFVAANLIYGLYVMYPLPSMKNWGERKLILSSSVVEWFGYNLLPPDEFSLEDRLHPDISPAYADLNGLCPALFTVGTLDPLLDDTLFMSQKWAIAGNETELAIYPGGIHAFDMFPDLTIARESHSRVEAFLRPFLD